VFSAFCASADAAAEAQRFSDISSRAQNFGVQRYFSPHPKGFPP